jgi:alkanesulfonate monooxygenase SsuD/methylene tetrahydromethanopterin reductase-like flavin-dependent oxidoreductase (luciferase family)
MRLRTRADATTAPELPIGVLAKMTPDRALCMRVTGDGIRVGLSLAAQDRAGMTDAATDFESRGFDVLAVADHVFNFRAPERPFLDGWIRLAALAAATRVVRIASLVTNVVWRSPVQIAKNAIALDQLSEGRFELGLGCGAYRDQRMMDVFEMPVSERVSRLDEGVEVINRLLRGDTTPFEGRYTRYDEAHTSPGCIQEPRPPLIIGAGAPRTIAITARSADIWNCATPDGDLDFMTAVLRDRVDRLTAACEGCERDPATVRRSLLLWSAAADPWAAKGAFERLIERFSPLGFSDFIALMPQPVHTEVLDHFTDTVLRERSARRSRSTP